MSTSSNDLKTSDPASALPRNPYFPVGVGLAGIFLVLLAIASVYAMNVFKATSEIFAQSQVITHAQERVNDLQESFTHVFRQEGDQSIGRRDRAVAVQKRWELALQHANEAIAKVEDHRARAAFQSDMDRLSYLSAQVIALTERRVQMPDHAPDAANLRTLHQQVLDALTRISNRMTQFSSRSSTDWQAERKQRRTVLLGLTVACQLFLLGTLVLFALAWRRHQKIKDASLAHEAKLQEQRASAERDALAKTGFLANMSHEIRTPMNGVLGMAELLLGTDLNERQRHFVRRIQLACEALMGVINSVLEFSRIESGQLVLAREPFNLRALISELESLFAPLVARKGIQLHCNVPDKFPANFIGDRERVQQVLFNLMAHAVQSTERGEVNVSLSELPMQDQESWVRIDVSDTGVGVPAELKDSLFDLDFNPSAVMPNEKRGGLGLALARQLVNLMGGNIGVDSRVGLGTNFQLQLPLPKAGNFLSEDNLRHLAPMPGMRVLLVDSMDRSRDVLAEQMAHWQIEVDAVQSLSQAARHLTQSGVDARPYHAILADTESQTPEAFPWPREVQLGALTILMSDQVMAVPLAQRERAGIDAVLQKPVASVELHGLLLRHWQEHQKQVKENPADAMRLVLLAEDNPINRELAETMLQLLGLKVTTVFNGRQAVERVRNGLVNLATMPDLVLMDCQMPEMDGYRASAEIREMERSMGQGARMPIIALTANVLEGDRDRCLEAGMDDHLGKPFTQDQLGAIVKRWLPTANGASSPHTEPLLSGETMTSQLDSKALDQIRMLEARGQKGLLAKVIHLFLNETPTLVERIEQAVTEHDAGRLRIAAHTMKSSAQSLGALRLGDLCMAMETAGREQNVVSHSDLHAFKQEYALVCDLLRAQIA